MKKFALIFITVVLLGCREEEPSLTESFFKIYDNSDFDLSYDPIDVVELNDGYIVITGTQRNTTDFQGVQIIKIDLEGEFVGDTELNDYVAPAGDIYFNTDDSVTYFFTANPTTLGAVLIGVDTELDVVTETPLGGINYPLASNVTSSGNLLLMSYDPVNLNTQISEISTTGNFVGGANFSIGAGNTINAEQIIIDHFTVVSEQELPFFCGEFSPGNYYFNGFYEFSFSLVFTDLSSITGQVQGQSINEGVREALNAGIRAVLPLSGSDFAVAGFQFSENFQLSSATLTTTGISSSADLFPDDRRELRPYTPSKIIAYTFGETNYTIFASETEGRQIILYFYDVTTGEIAGIHNIGFINPFTLSSMKITEDNSLLVLGTTFVAGRFERMMLTKISERQIGDILN
ncbi:MAG: hypothetical protein AAGA66_12415 [Bacteroidota bacterium]